MNIWRDRLQRWFEPVARRSPLSPNAITCLALVLAIGGGAAFAFGARDRRLFLIGLLFVGISGLLDAFDGIVARVQQKTSRFGDFLDHFCDRVSDTFIFGGWLLGAEVEPWIGMTALALMLLVGYLGTQIEASFGKRSYNETGRGEFILAMIILPIASFLFADHRAVVPGPYELADWLALLVGAFAIAGITQRIKLARHLSVTS